MKTYPLSSAHAFMTSGSKRTGLRFYVGALYRIKGKFPKVGAVLPAWRNEEFLPFCFNDFPYLLRL